MFEHQQKEAAYSTLALKVVAASACGLLLSFGLCAVGSLDRLFEPIDVAALFVFGLAVLGIVVGAVWLFLSVVVRSLRR